MFNACYSSDDRVIAENAEGIESNWDETTTTFDDMNLKENLLRGIFAYGFEKPSAIQQVFILLCSAGNVFILC